MSSCDGGRGSRGRGDGGRGNGGRGSRGRGDGGRGNGGRGDGERGDGGRGDGGRGDGGRGDGGRGDGGRGDGERGDGGRGEVSVIRSPFPLLENVDVSRRCFAYVPRCDYPSVSLVSTTFHDFITDSDSRFAINNQRSQLQRTENVLYVALRFSREEKTVWYTLNQKPYKKESESLNHKLVPFPSFPSLPYYGFSVTVIGQEIYVLGGYCDGVVTNKAYVINCLSSKRRDLPSMRLARAWFDSGVIDGKIYVIGGCRRDQKLYEDCWVEVFDLKKETWEFYPGLFIEDEKHRVNGFVMNEKIYVVDRFQSFVCDPKTSKWEIEDTLYMKWRHGSCVIDNMMYSIDIVRTNLGTENRISVYDLTARSWSYLEGVDEDLPDFPDVQWSITVNHGGKLAILVMRKENRETNVWCKEIELERRGPSEIWGTVLWTNLVATFGHDSPTFVECLSFRI